MSQLARIGMGHIASLMVERTLAYSESKADLMELQRSFLEESEVPIWENMIRAERAQAEHYMVWYDDVNLSPAIGGSFEDTIEVNIRCYLRCYTPYCRAKNIEFSSILLQISHKPTQKWRDAVSALPNRGDYRQRNGGYIQSGLWDILVESCLKGKARLRTAAAAIACERYRQANGHWPSALIDIPKSIIPETPLDPFDGQPLRLQKNDDGITIYSTGVYKKINQDIWAQDKGTTIPAISFRLWDVPQRGKLPPIN